MNLDINNIKNIFVLISVAGAVFALVALIHNEVYLNVGLVTFVFGVIADRVNTTLWVLYCEPKSKTWLLYVVDALILAIWIFTAWHLLPN